MFEMLHIQYFISFYISCCILTVCTHGEVHSPLLGGASKSDGLMEMCVDGSYLPVSLDNGRFSVREATVICKQLGLGNGIRHTGVKT